MGGTCVECGGEGEVPHPFDSRVWPKHPHPEFLLEDVPDLIRALADLPTWPEAVKKAIAA
jgi:hypothetical protein